MISMKRRLGKTIILLLLVFILGNIISGAIAVQQAVTNTETNLKQNLPAVATLEMDYESYWAHQDATGEWAPAENLSSALIEQVAALPYVQDYDYSVMYTTFYSHDIERWNHPDPEFEHIIWEPTKEVDGLTQFDVKGIHNPEVLDINAGLIELTNGRTFTEQEINNFNQVNSFAIISQALADLNNLTVGSTFVLDNTIYDEFDESTWNLPPEELYSVDNILATESYELEVIGIFQPLASSRSGDEWQDAEQEIQLANRIYVPNALAETHTSFRVAAIEELGLYDDWEYTDEELESAKKPVYSSIFLLSDPLDLEVFAQEANESLPEFWMVSDLSNTFSDIASSMETLQWLASLILWISIVATLLILSLLITLFLRDRKHEIGIYLALGEQKIKVIAQIILEVVATGFVAITLSLFSGSLLARGISENMLRNDLIAQQGNSWDNGIYYGDGSDQLRYYAPEELTPEEMLENYEIALNGTTIILFYSIGTGALLLSTVVPIAYVMRLNPKKILM